MEIITYMDNRKVNFGSQTKFARKLEGSRKRQNHKRFGFPSKAINAYRYGASASSIALQEGSAAFVEKSYDISKNILWYLTHRLFRILLLVVMAALGVGLTLGTRNLFGYLTSIARPVDLPFLPAQELEILDSAMSRFAFMSENEVDANGNLLIDGQKISLADISFSQPVTFQTYTVKSGDTISGITYKFGLTNISTLIAVNDIGNVRQLRSGQKLKIPSMDGLLYTVATNDTLEGLSTRYKVTVEDILDVNDLDSVTLNKGQQLFIPGAKMDATSLQKAMGELFIWPLSGGYRISSRFGPRLDPFTGVPSSHTGIDLAIVQGTPIKAAMSGKIAVVGYTNVYGNYVIIDHENGYQTLYAHLQKPAPVTKGQRVAQGTKIGLVGNTGYSTGPHLHFTVYKNGKLIDPETVLKR
ncbi:MAG: M23 family metallopeptidase [Treponema sp.]|nr:M23 family metallopeptidase [Treponema sp.]